MILIFFKSYKYQLAFYLILLVLSLFPIALSTVSSIKNTNSHKELFNIELSRFQTIDDITAHIDGIYSATYSSSNIDTFAYVKITSDVIKKRFFHGLSQYSFKENWIAALSGKILWNHLSAIIEPDDILNYNEGLCSQQAIVFLEILKSKGIKTRWVGLGYKEGPGHFLAEVYYQGKWHLYDVNMEPKWNRIINEHKSMDYYLRSPDTLYVAYQGILDKQRFNKIMEKVEYGDVNEFPAKNMLLFHRITKIMTYLLPVFFMLMIIMTLFKQKVPAKIIKKTTVKFRPKKVNSL